MGKYNTFLIDGLAVTVHLSHCDYIIIILLFAYTLSWIDIEENNIKKQVALMLY